jgi:beta-1,2-mannobiose phosphorylase / 1,2-beta-oligomannan phosphorylase
MKNINIQIAGLLIALMSFACSVKPAENALVFSYFIGNGEDGLHLAISEDGLVWEEINDGKSILPPLVGESCLMRDPCITIGPDSTFHMVWTTSWSGKTIGYASSKDLVNWSTQIAVPVMVHEDSVMNCWAPEINYNEADGNYIIYWSSTITDKFPETATSTPQGNKRNHRIYYTTTKDFKSFSETELFYDPGFNVIDASINKSGDGYVMFLKNETELPVAEKNILTAFADQITGPYTIPEKPITGDYWAEGPTSIQIDDKWHVYFDVYMEKKYGLITSTDLENWTDESEKLHVPNGLKHGTVIKVDRAIYDNLKTVRKESPMLYRDVSRKGRPFSKDPTVIKFNGQYMMYYTIPDGTKPEQNGWHIGIATSPDMIIWEKSGEVLPAADYEKNGLCAPDAEVIDGKVHLFYQTYGNGPKDAICHAVSEDGIHFKRNDTNPIFSPSGAWNIGRAIDAEVFIEGDSVFLYWATRDPDFKQQLLGVSKAAMSGGFNRESWKQISKKPLLKPELPWEMNCIEAASVFKENEKYYMFYAGAYNSEGQQIGLAASSDGIHWERTSTEPVLRRGMENQWNSTESGHPGVFIDDDGTKWLFYQGNPDKGYTYYLSKLKFTITSSDQVVFEETP